MAGIERIEIVEGNPIDISGGGWRFAWSKRHQVHTNKLYHHIFRGLLEPGSEVTQVCKDEFMAGYDRHLGVDMFLHFRNGMLATLQEKILRYARETTVTVEYMQDWRKEEPGDWFNIKTQFYFVGYDNLHYRCLGIKEHRLQGVVEREIATGMCNDCGEPFFCLEWIMLNWPMVLLETAKGNIDWQEKHNQEDYARASMRYAPFSAFPPNCVIGKYEMKTKREAWTINRVKHREKAKRMGLHWNTIQPHEVLQFS